MAKKDFRGYLVGNGFPRVSRRGHRGGPEDHGQNGRKWPKMVENGRKWQKMAGNGRKWQKKSSPRLFGRKWTFRVFCVIPLLLMFQYQIVSLCNAIIRMKNRIMDVDSSLHYQPKKKS